MRRILMLTFLLTLLAVPESAVAADNIFRQVAGNAADKLGRLPLDGYSYDEATHCVKHPQKGTTALETWLGKHAGGVSWGINRCEKWGPHSASLHAEGRALDWHLDAHSGADRAEATRLIDLFLAPDRQGNTHALARRMGIQELIWNCHGWFSGDGGMGHYSLCYDRKGKRKKIDDTNAHRNHIHIGLNWSGARMKSSFWKQAAAARR